MKKPLLQVLAALAIAALCAGAVAAGRPYFMPSEKARVDRKMLARSKGDPAAKLWIVEYMDFQCQACSLGAVRLDRLMKERPGEIFLQVRSYPLKMHKHGVRSAVFAECAARQKKFWPFYETVLAAQREWENLPDIDAAFLKYAAEAGLDAKRLEACAKNPRVREAVLDETLKAKEVGVSATPTFFLNGKMAVGPKAFEAALAEYFAGEGKS